MTTEQMAAAETGRSYIQHNGAKSTESIVELIEKGHGELFASIEGLSDAQATFKPSADDWSVLETMRHVVAAKQGVALICERLARNEMPKNVGGEGQASRQDGIMREEYPNLGEASAAAQAAHDDLLAFVRGRSGEANVDARYNHFIFGDLNCREWAVFQRVHDADHGNQIQQVMASPGFPKS